MKKNTAYIMLFLSYAFCFHITCIYSSNFPSDCIGDGSCHFSCSIRPFFSGYSNTVDKLLLRTTMFMDFLLSISNTFVSYFGNINQGFFCPIFWQVQTSICPKF